METMTIPFVANTDDDLHCVPAAYAMVVGALTGRIMTMEEAEELTGWDATRPTWQFKGMLGLADMGLSVVDIEHFSPADFADDPVTSIRRQVADPTTADEILAVTDTSAEAELARLCISNPRITFVDEIPTIEGLASEIGSGGVAICVINPRVLRGEGGYAGHYVVVTAVGQETITFHDPGLPPVPNHTVSHQGFEAAWYWPHSAVASMVIARPNDGITKQPGEGVSVMANDNKSSMPMPGTGSGTKGGGGSGGSGGSGDKK